MNYILFDGHERDSLLPLTYTRPVADIRIGILTIREKWEKYFGYTTSTLTEDYLAGKFPFVELDVNIMINGSYCPNAELVDMCNMLKEKEAIYYKGEMVAFIVDSADDVPLDDFEKIEYEGDLIHIEHPWDIFSNNEQVLRDDFDLITNGRVSEPLSDTNRVLNPENIFIEEGAEVEFSILNAKDAPIYIGRNAKIMENVSVRGGLALCEGSSLKMGAKIYGATTIGPFSVVGGEVKNIVIFSYSNKGHEGYLGNSVIGEWCNFGADTNSSNLKNNFGNVKVWNYEVDDYVDTGLSFHGLIMADHSKTGINTMLNTGTVIGVSCNVFGSGFPPKFIPSFSWGGSEGFESYRIDKAKISAQKWMDLRHVPFTVEDLNIFDGLYEACKDYRV